MTTGETSSACGRCGTGNTLDSNYCKSCGAPLAAPTSISRAVGAKASGLSARAKWGARRSRRANPTTALARRIPLEIAGQGATAMAPQSGDPSRFLWRWVGLAAAFALVLLLLASRWVKGQLGAGEVETIAWKSLAATAVAGLFTGLAVGRLGRGRVVLESLVGAALAYSAVALLVVTQGRFHVAQLIGLAPIALASAVGAWLGARFRPISG